VSGIADRFRRAVIAAIASGSVVDRSSQVSGRNSRQPYGAEAASEAACTLTAIPVSPLKVSTGSLYRAICLRGFCQFCGRPTRQGPADLA